MPDELTQVMRWEEQNRNFFHYIVKGQYFWKAEKALARSPPFPPPPLPLCPLSCSSLWTVSVKDRSAITSNEACVLLQVIHLFWHRRSTEVHYLGSVFRLCIQAALLARDAMIPTTHYYLWMLSARTLLHLLHAARHEPCKTEKQ